MLALGGRHVIRLSGGDGLAVRFPSGRDGDPCNAGEGAPNCSSPQRKKRSNIRLFLLPLLRLPIPNPPSLFWDITSSQKEADQNLICKVAYILLANRFRHLISRNSYHNGDDENFFTLVLGRLIEILHTYFFFVYKVKMNDDIYHMKWKVVWSLAFVRFLRRNNVAPFTPSYSIHRQSKNTCQLFFYCLTRRNRYIDFSTSDLVVISIKGARFVQEKVQFINKLTVCLFSNLFQETQWRIEMETNYEL